MEIYEQVSGQMVNKIKSEFYSVFQENDQRVNDIKEISGFPVGQFPMQYLGCPIYAGRKKIV